MILEFALIALVLFFLVAAVLDLGRGVFLAQTAQTVARTAARELALVPLPASTSFEGALASAEVRERIFDDRWLVIDLDDLDNPETAAVESTLDELFASLPPVNQSLRPLMMVDHPVLDGSARRLLRVPGTLLSSAAPDVEFTVQVPIVLDRDAATGNETDVVWARVIEEVRPDRSDPSTGVFSMVAPGGGVLAPDGGLVSLRVNVALQAASLTAHVPNAAGPFEPNIVNVIEADDTAVLVDADVPLDGAQLLGELSGQQGAYGGASGLGQLLAQSKTVRPFRRVLSAQAVFRRELALP
ncbi:MAG: pilus biosynthesis protein TadE [Planctomycetota bacterium]|nr:MAG: pilus biosynthesis protein TadE [Planctomycetota bacterium]